LSTSAEEKDFEAVLERIRDARNFDFRNYKKATLRRRIERRLGERGCRNMREYLSFLDKHPDEFDALISQMLIKVTSFFRDEEMWKQLSSKLIPDMMHHKRHGEEIRIWSAGCATGEEAFSVAICMAEVLGAAIGNYEIKVFGTDVDEAAIAAARRGIFSAQQVDDVPKNQLNHYFTRVAEGFTIRKEIRRMVVFGVNNLVSDAPISRLDVLICRNVFIYLDANLQKRVLTRFHYALRREGLLILGKSELIPFAGKIFQAVDLSRRIYRKDGRSDVPLSAQERLIGLLEQENIKRVVGESEQELSMLGQYHHDVVQSIGIPLVVTALDGTVTLWNSAAAKMWSRSEGDVLGKKLTALSLPGMTGDLLIEKTTLVREGKSNRETAESLINKPGEQKSIHVRIEVAPMRTMGEELTALLYAVHEVTAFRNLEGELRRVSDERQAAVEELQTTNEELQSSNEELETTNEELQSANEELQTTNEELQSTNEELETTNEELQSTNAELDATNRELAHRTEELNLLGFYQRTIIRSLSAAVVVLDVHGRITLWNLAAERLLGLPESEALGQLFWTLRVPAFSKTVVGRIRKSLGQRLALRIEEIGYELPTGGRGYGNLAAVPLIDNNNHLGSVLIFEDCTRAANLARDFTRLKEERTGRGRDRK